MTPHSDPYSQNYHDIEQQPASASMPPASDITPPMGETPPQVLAEQAAEGHRGAAWRLMIWILKNDSRAVVAVSSLDDDRLARNLLEFIALGTWAGKPFVVPLPLRSPYARTRLRTLFMPGAGMDSERAHRVLMAGMHSPDPHMRENAAYLLGQIGNRNDVPILMNALKDPSPGVRLQAARALGRLRAVEAVPALLSALHSADELLGAQIFHALVQIGVPAVPALIAESSSLSAWTRWHCVRALGEINDARAIPTLAQSLNDPDHGVAWMAAKELIQFGKLIVVPTLQVLLSKDTSPWLAETGSYVLHQLYMRYRKLKPYLAPLVQEMQQPSFKIGTALAAQKTLQKIENDKVLQQTTQELSATEWS
ncbi:HEAT repeat domain-containing protein [Dictyobacter kobayashii]|uniref:HEAT repeat domain-containing protein n=1 Tax=Dictyobacter kobayashii TaxID=2014872 RepID=A0A402ACU1_9CHLR|nr:HEAT repeat domain-containing protein [Dictyobacter kobayashii]GCE16898.1 hypothetical protein KDK_06980 [Dictyobacter kobayashii]